MVHSRPDLGSLHVLISDGRVIISVSAPHCLRDRLSSSQSALHAVSVPVHTYKSAVHITQVPPLPPPLSCWRIGRIDWTIPPMQGIHHTCKHGFITLAIIFNIISTVIVIILLISYLSNGDGPLLPPRGGAPAEFSRKRWTPG